MGLSRGFHPFNTLWNARHQRRRRRTNASVYLKKICPALPVAGAGAGDAGHLPVCCRQIFVRRARRRRRRRRTVASALERKILSGAPAPTQVFTE